MEKDAAWCLEHPYKPENNINTISCTIEELREVTTGNLRGLWIIVKKNL